MTPADAAKLLDIPADATPEQLEARFNELRAKLEDKIAKAPTPGLKAKYRESLDEITSAFETLILAADSSTLPVTQKSGAPVAGVADAGRTRSPSPIPGSATPVPAKRAKSGGKEFVIVAVVAVVLLGAGGWFVMKTRAENAEAARVAAEAKAEGERQAAAAQVEKDRLDQAARFEAEEKKKAEENERIRLEKLTAQLRADLAETKVAWEAFEREERAAERRLAELKSDLRGMRDAPAGRMAEAQAAASAQQDYYQWLSDTLARHPAKVARGRAEELLSARQPDEAKAAIAELTTQLRALESEIPRQRAALLDLDGEVTFKTNPDVSWSLTDAFGRTRTGKGPAEFKDVAIGRAELKLRKAGWPDRTESLDVRRSQPASLDAVFTGSKVQVVSAPAGAQAFGPDGREIGTTPLQLTELAPGTYDLVLKLAGHYDERIRFSTPGTPAELGPVKLRARVTKPVKPVWRLPSRFTLETVFNSSTDGNRSTGTFAKDAWRYNNQSAYTTVVEWSLSDPDADGAWTRADARVISSSVAVPSGQVSRYTRQPNGKWSVRTADGSTIETAVEATWGNAWIDTSWPPENTAVGESWKVDAHTTGRLVAFDRTATDDWATLQFRTDRVTKGEAETRSQKTVTLRVNLGEGYVASCESTSHDSMTVKAVLIGQIATDTRTTSNIKLTVPDR